MSMEAVEPSMDAAEVLLFDLSFLTSDHNEKKIDNRL